jgi:hypothetical protein
MDMPTVKLRWSSPISFDGADASAIPNRGGVYEVLEDPGSGVERLWVGQTGDLRRGFVAHMAGSVGDPKVHAAVSGGKASFRYWLCEDTNRRLEVVQALVDLHCYEIGHEPLQDVGCVRLVETY